MRTLGIRCPCRANCHTLQPNATSDTTIIPTIQEPLKV